MKRTKEDIAAIVRYRLDDWADWTQRNMGSGNPLYYPSSTAEGRIRKGGLAGGGQPGHSRSPNGMPVSVAEIDRIVRFLPDVMNKAVRIQYLTTVTHEEKAILFSEWSRLPVSAYQRELRDARNMIGGFLLSPGHFGPRDERD
jgi:hypothetical protein